MLPVLDTTKLWTKY